MPSQKKRKERNSWIHFSHPSGKKRTKETRPIHHNTIIHERRNSQKNKEEEQQQH
jgi:hypothetical protein